jgi:hypothetical protein
MKAHIIVLLALKISMIVQVILILAKVQSVDSIVYLISDMLFKGILGAFLFIYFVINGSPSFDSWDEVFIGFGGVLLMFDAFYNVFPKVLHNYNIYFNPYTFDLSAPPGSAATSAPPQIP